jgi:hypothetical protein
MDEGTMTIETSATLPCPDQVSSRSCEAPAEWTANVGSSVEKRRETRYATCEPIDVNLLDINNLRLSGMLRDISKNGMRIELDMPLKTGDRLEVVLRNKIIVFAEVRYCSQTGEFHQIGIVIDDVYYPKADSPERRAPGRTSEGAIHEVVGFRHPVKTERLGVHLDRYDVDNLLKLRLSETRTALLERHLASCDQCLDLVLRTLDDRASSSSPSPKSDWGQS